MSELIALQQSQQAKREKLAQWRASQKHELALPSGLNVLVRDASLTDLMIAGTIPQTFLNEIAAAAETGSNKVNVDLKKFAGSQDFGALIQGIVRVCLLEPRIVETPDDDNITLDELSGDDKMAIFEWANREVEAVRPFRETGAGTPAAQPVDAA